MLIARAPVRISFGGGGTDLAAYYERYGGIVVSAAINKYCYSVVSADGAHDLQIISADYAAFHRQPVLPPANGHRNGHRPGGEIGGQGDGDADDLDHWSGDLALPKAVVDYLGLQCGLSIFLASEVPPGTGLGSSSAVAVSLIHALTTLDQRQYSRREIAEMAAYIEIEKLGMPIGKQDQYAAAFGGLNVFTFTAGGVDVTPLRLPAETVAQLEQRLLLFFTGSSRHSASILRHQRRATLEGQGVVVESLHAIKRAALAMIRALERGDLDAFGHLLDHAWTRKKLLAAEITNQRIDECYQIARGCGALGGKITGAGGGGFLMLYCPPERQAAVTAALEAKGLQRMAFRFDYQGAEVLLNTFPARATRVLRLRRTVARPAPAVAEPASAHNEPAVLHDLVARLQAS